MGVLQRFERSLGGLVEGAFARIFGGHVQPVEVAAALTREAEDKKAIVGAGRVLVPNTYVVELGDADTDRLTEYDEPLRVELAAMLREAAAEQGWSFVGPVEVRLERTAGLGTGVFRVRSSVVAAAPDALSPGVQSPEAQSPGAPSLGGESLGGQSPGGQREKPDEFAGEVAAPAAPPARPSGRHVPLVVTPRPTPSPVAAASAASGVAGPHLVVLGHGPAAAELDRTVRLTGPVAVIGRGAEADVQLTDTGVSRRHAEVRLTTPPTLVDLGSTNGTRLNSQPVARGDLRDGDRIGVGTSELVFRTGEPA